MFVKTASGRILALKQSQTDCYSPKKFNFQEHFFLFNYEDEIREKIIEYKFQDKAYLCDTFAKLFIEDNNFTDFIKEYNFITCIPLHKKRFKSRGYNQSDLIAKKIARHFGIAYCNNILIKQKNIVAQSTLNKADRQTNIKNVFKFNNNFFNSFNNVKKLPFGVFPNSNFTNNLKIAIFDDIFTTGATLNEAAKNLSILKPSKLGVITIAKDFVKSD